PGGTCFAPSLLTGLRPASVMCYAGGGLIAPGPWRRADVFADADGGSHGSLLWDVLGLLSVPALVLLNGLFVAAEFALVSVRKTRLEELQEKGVKGARSALSAVQNLDDSIAATQLGITLASIALGFVGEPTLAHFLRPLFSALPESWQGVATHGAAT